MAKVALLVGVSEYEPGLNPLPAAVKDVEAIQQVLLHTDIGGFVQADVTLLTNPARQQMEEAIENLFAGRHRDDLVLFFFSGHGIKDDTGRLYLATHKTRKNPQGDLIRSSAVSASFVQESMSRSRSRRQVVILDCCFSGAFAQGLLVRDDGTVNIQEQLGGEGRAILTSSSSTQYSFEQEGSELSIYTRYLVEGIQTGVADLDEDGFISIDELHEYAKKKVRDIQPLMKPEIYAIREGFKIRLTKVPLIDPKQKYRKEVARYIDRGEISFVGRNILDLVRNRFGLSVAEATAIENEILEPYRKQFREKLKQYEQVFTELIKKKLIISEIDRQHLRHFQQSLHLNDEDTASIEKQVTAVIEAYRKNLQWYEQEFSKAVRQEYPLSASTSNQLQQMQQQLQLADEDISFIQTRVTAEVGAYKQKLQQYENLFLSAIQKKYPFSEAKRQELQEQQGFLGLTHEDVAPIEARITAQIEEHQQKLRQYEQVLNNEIERAYPMSDRTREELRRFQYTLELSDEDIVLIEKRVFENRRVVQPIANNLSANSTLPHKQNPQPVQEETTQNGQGVKPKSVPSTTTKSSDSTKSWLTTLRTLKQLFVIPLLLVVVSLLLGYLWHQGSLPIKKLTNSSPRIIPSEGIPLVAPPIKSGSQDGSDKSAANAAQVIQTTSEIEFIKTTSPPTGVIAPKGSVLQILSRSEKIEKDSWIYLRVCSIGQASPSNSQSTSSTANKPVVSLGDEVKILSSKFKSLKVPKAKPEVVSQCQPSKQTSISSPAVKESAAESKPKSVPPQ
ncbi:caspase family protein [Brasilonema sp. UFV-L1]|uniref:caspase family protein n=1 Tax=Brasilonema sp. UFV-L1 TaxID=2234130 RepID=UPI00145D83F1|nr:caspase family protein [Brasilonema sp. UFV-L1]NMG05982.1 hypothetical protein [Brasilonema sp. UFV-L1]